MQLQDKKRDIYVVWFGASYIRDFTVIGNMGIATQITGSKRHTHEA